MMDPTKLRIRRITASIDLDGFGIEYGPLNRIVVDKTRHKNVKYVDFASRNELVKKYSSNPNFNTDIIPEIDIVTGGTPITKFVEKSTLDYVIASHVLEHVPDMIGWLEANLSLLKPGGCVCLAFPDRRYCFDLAKNPTLFSDLIPPYLEGRQQPSFAQICDHIFNTVRATAVDAWSGPVNARNAETVHPKEQAFRAVKKLYGKTDYVDSHCWKFSDMEFLSVMGDIRKIIGLPFEVISFFPTAENTSEFYMTIQKS